MAGIGFELRKLARRDDLLGLVESYAHSALASTGPWLFTILALGGVVMFGSRFIPFDEMAEFRLIVIYNFAFSLVISAPVAMVSMRHLADSIYAKNVEDSPSLLLTGIMMVFVLELPFVVSFYGYYVHLSLTIRLLAIANFFVVSGIWPACVFLTALKDYRRLSFSFVAGMAFVLGSAGLAAPFWGLTGILAGFTGGLIVLLCLLIARVLAEYPYEIRCPFGFASQFRAYWDLALSGLIYNLAIWIDKLIMWSSPERSVLPSGLVSYSDYDSAMFLAYLTIVPTMASFVLSVETDFFEKYVRYYREIQQHASFLRIEQNHKSIIESVLRGARNFIILQGTVSLVSILLAPHLFTALNIGFLQLGMFRIGVLGAFFHMLFLAIMILLSYFDMRRLTLGIQSAFLLLNAVCTIIASRLGFQFYGYGYFAAAIITFAVSFVAISRVLNRLPYQTFVLSNSSLS
jgi:uncharacterized membrane protein